MARGLDLNPEVPGHAQLIQGYREGGFTIGGTRHEGAVLVLRERTLAWDVAAFEDITAESLEPVLAAEPAIEILVLGAGARFAMVSPAFRQALRERGVAVESMATPAACRTFDVLLAEDRRVAAALIPI
jgi:uncharacterized protein